MRPPKPPILHRLEQRRASRTGEDVGPMFWAAVFVAAGLAIGIVTLGAPI